MIRLDPERVDDEKVIAPFVVEGVEDDADPVVGPRLITVREMGADRERVGVVGAKTHVKPRLVVHHKDLGAYRCRRVLARLHLVVESHGPRPLPDGLVEDPVDIDPGVDAGDLKWCPRFVVR